MPIEHINKTDTLNEGREKINEAIDGANAADVTSKAADTKATQALANSESTQTQLDTIVIDGDSSVEAAQARVDEKGVPHPTLKARIDDGMNSVNSQLAETVDYATNMGGILHRHKHEKKAVVTFISDDGSIEDYTKLKPILEEKEITIGLGIVTSWMNTSGYMSTEQIKEMEELGCEILSHSDKHKNFSTLSEQEQEMEFKRSKELLTAEGFTPKMFVYPFNETTSASRKYLPKYFNGGFARFNRANSSASGVNTPYFLNREIARNSQGSFFDSPAEGLPQDGSSLEYYKALVDNAKDINNGLVFVLHPHFVEDEIQFEYLKQLIDYIKESNLDIVNPSEFLNIYGNIIEIDGEEGQLIIQADGSMRTNLIQINTLKMNSKNITDKITDFEYGKISTVPISNNFARENGFPGNDGGELETHRLTSEYYHNFQIYRRTYRANETYIRFVDSDYEWLPFENLSRVFYRVEEGTNNFTVSTKPSQYPYRRTTKFVVDSNGSEGFPTNSAGVVTVDRLGDQLSYTKQYFVSNATNEMWIRSGKTDDTWSDFVKVGS